MENYMKQKVNVVDVACLYVPDGQAELVVLLPLPEGGLRHGGLLPGSRASVCNIRVQVWYGNIALV